MFRPVFTGAFALTVLLLSPFAWAECGWYPTYHQLSRRILELPEDRCVIKFLGNYSDSPTTLALLYDTVADTTSGHALARSFYALAKSGVDIDTVPAPTKTALRHYFGDYLYYDFQPDLFWPHYPEDWQTGMRNCLEHAIRTRYPYRNLHHAVDLIPLFFTREEIAQLDDLESLSQAASHMLQIRSIDWNQGWQAEGVRKWIEGIVEHAPEDRARDVIYTLYINPGRRTYGRPPAVAPRHGTQDGPWLAQQHCRRSIDYSWPTDAPFVSWLREHPEETADLIQDASFGVRQYVFHLLVRDLPEQLPPIEDPLTIHLHMEQLRSDCYCGNEDRSKGALAAHPEATLPYIREKIVAPDDGQQAWILAELLSSVGTAEDVRLAADYYYELLHARETDRTLRTWGGNWRDTRWAETAKRLLEIGEPAAGFLREKVVSECTDPQQMGASIVVIGQISGPKSIPWNGHILEVLTQGLAANRTDHDQGLCTWALKQGYGNAQVLAHLREVGADSGDAQQRLSAQVLTAYLTGNMSLYHQLKWEHSFFGSRHSPYYWEADLFAALQGVPILH